MNWIIGVIAIVLSLGKGNSKNNVSESPTSEPNTNPPINEVFVVRLLSIMLQSFDTILPPSGIQSQCNTLSELYATDDNVFIYLINEYEQLKGYSLKIGINRLKETEAVFKRPFCADNLILNKVLDRMNNLGL